MQAEADVPSPPAIVWRVGFSGHRRVAEPARLGEILDKLWQDLAGRVTGKLEACASLAEGADLIFAESAQRAGLAFHARLPYSLDEFRKEVGNDWLPRFVQTVATASSIDAPPTITDRNSAYYNGGIDVIEQSDLMIFFWDGERERGHGGTAQMVRTARARALPLIWIHASDFELTLENFPSRPLRDPVADSLAPLWHSANSPSTVDICGAPPANFDQFDKLDSAATRCAPRYRFIVIYSIIIHVAVIAVAIVALSLTSDIWLRAAAVIKAALILSVLFLSVYARKCRLHPTWLACRIGAELARSLTATTSILSPTERESLLDSFPEYRRLLRPLSSRPRPRDAGENFAHYRNQYLRERIKVQQSYFSGICLRLQNRRRLLWLTGFIFASAGMFSAIALLATNAPPWSLLVAVFPLLSLMILALQDCLALDRRIECSQSMNKQLEISHARIAEIEDEWHLRREVLRIERLLCQEMDEWAQRTRHFTTR